MLKWNPFFSSFVVLAACIMLDMRKNWYTSWSQSLNQLVYLVGETRLLRHICVGVFNAAVVISSPTCNLVTSWTPSSLFIIKEKKMRIQWVIWGLNFISHHFFFANIAQGIAWRHIKMHKRTLQNVNICVCKFKNKTEFGARIKFIFHWIFALKIWGKSEEQWNRILGKNVSKKRQDF